MAVEPRQPPSPSCAEAHRDALPVLTARHGEMPLAPEMRRADLFSTRFVDSVRAEPKPHARSERAVPNQNPAPVHLATVFTPYVGATKVAETLQTATATPLAEPNWRVVEQLAHHIERMVYEREHDSITLRLDPPELGVIELRVRASGNEVQAWVNAERDLTRQMLQQTQQQLREQLEARGLQLTHFDIGGQTNPHYAQARSYRTPATQSTSIPHPSTATDSLLHDGRWSVWV
ncbi:MAG: flagellar hook-length control protein FliK [Fimbriimonadales bacterium]